MLMVLLLYPSGKIEDPEPDRLCGYIIMGKRGGFLWEEEMIFPAVRLHLVT